MNTLEALQVNGDKVQTKGMNAQLIDGETFFIIDNVDELRPFFMSVVSDSDHWLFVSSNAALTAGRKNSEHSLFPYYTDDKITDSVENTGVKTVFRVLTNEGVTVWEPFSNLQTGRYRTQRNLYKNKAGNAIVFEEVNLDLQLTYSYKWQTSDAFGFVRSCKLENNAAKEIEVEVLDGFQNILPAGVGSDLQNAYSNLVDAYKRTELDAATGLGIFALSAVIVDRAEASEALKANTVWSYGFNKANYLVSNLQLDSFRNIGTIETETDVKAERGCYFIVSKVQLKASELKEWGFVLNTNRNHAQVFDLLHKLKSKSTLLDDLKEDIRFGNKNLIALTSEADGQQLTSDSARCTRHYFNTLFNCMRGGIFDDGYKIEKWDLVNYLKKANKQVFNSIESELNKLNDNLNRNALVLWVKELNNLDAERLILEYMPLKFSRRHGDPSRPWNKFSINTKDPITGDKILDYQGNWRDIFQNWEALAHAYPNFVPNMVTKFFNASTFDGYNPYRVTKDGFDWETIEPDDPWSYIGYWGDHQIIYLLKFLEFLNDYQPNQINELLAKEIFVYANVPYRIKPYGEILKDPKDTILFDQASDDTIREKRNTIGADGALLHSQKGEVVRANFLEKILATTLAKLSNFIPEAGIWMNTQRPEWNDANNALVGNGVSMVTLCYLNRFVKFFSQIAHTLDFDTVKISSELEALYTTIHAVLESNKDLLESSINDTQRKEITDALGIAGSTYRETIYENNFSGTKKAITKQSFVEFLDVTQKFLQHSIAQNQRADKLFHAYNLVEFDQDTVKISHLDEMLEGQVAVLSANYLNSNQVLEVLDSLKSSKLFREDQYSYLLYPYKKLKGFLDRNKIAADKVNESVLLKRLVEKGDNSIVEKDINGDFHFNANFRNADGLEQALKGLENTNESEKVQVLELYEEIFNHKEFTGRSGTFYGYEGLGSIYWHMVSKLHLAVQECLINAIDTNFDSDKLGRLFDHYFEIGAGIGVHKSPDLYGAFPTDPYSHTPGGKGAQQPGMTGQVKEDLLVRMREMGRSVKAGKLSFDPALLRKSEFLDSEETLTFFDINKAEHKIHLSHNQMAFTVCQVPAIYTLSQKNEMVLELSNGEEKMFSGLELDEVWSKKLFDRTAEIKTIHIAIQAEKFCS